MTKLEEIDGIGPTFAQKLREAGIETVAGLLSMGATPEGRERIAAETGIPQRLIVRWVNMADLFRIDGLGEEYAELLEAAGADTVVELARCSPTNLLEKMREINDAKQIARTLPAAAQVEAWILRARGFPPGVRH